MQATIHLDTQYRAGAIDRRIFGGFLEHLGRAVYEGVFDPGNPRSDAQGFRRDVLEALRPLGMSVVRYPGGNFVSCYDWKDGIGAREGRPHRPDFAWKSVESNAFGTDEFLSWCSELGTEPMLAVNLGTGAPADAAHLLEYCNLATGTYWADQRRRNGQAEPYDVKLWCLGNEMDGPWQAGHMPAEAYAQKARQASALMKGLDPSIETVVCGSSSREMPNYMEWDRTVLEYCWDTVDYISAHRYSRKAQDDSAAFLAEGVVIDRILDDYAGLLNYVRGAKRSNRRVYLSFDEWNVWYRASADNGEWTQAPNLLEEQYNLEDALVCAQYLNAFVRRADLVKVACLAQIVNVIAPVLTRPDGLLIQTIYHPFYLFSRHARGESLTPIIASPEYSAGSHGDTPVLDASASYDEAEQTVSLFLVNRRPQEPLTVDIFVADAEIAQLLDVQTLSGDVAAANTWEHPDAVAPITGEGSVSDGRLRITIPAPGLTVARVRLAAR